MKHHQLILCMLIIFFHFSCKEEAERGLNQNLSYEKEQFLKLVHRAYFVEGKYYLSGCDMRFKALEKEIRLNDTIMAVNGFNSSISFIVKDLNKDSIEFETISSSTGCLVMPGETSPSVSISKLKPFKIKCQNQREIIKSVFIEGEEVSKETAERHISEGKFYLLKDYPKKGQSSGIEQNKDECLQLACNKFGFEFYHISECIPTSKQFKQLEEYNTAMYKHLKQKKELEYDNFRMMESAFRSEIWKCRKEKNNK